MQENLPLNLHASGIGLTATTRIAAACFLKRLYDSLNFAKLHLDESKLVKLTSNQDTLTA